MKNTAIKFSLMSLVLLGGCSFSKDALFPSLMGSEAQEDMVRDSNAGSDIAIPAIGKTNFEPVEVSKGSDTGTFVGQKVSTFRSELKQLQTAIKNHNSELQQLRSSVVNNALAYHKTTGNMEAKLQVGTTPGNPQMFAMMQSAQSNVQAMNANTIALNQLSNRVSSDAAMTSYLLDSIRSTYSVSGAVDEDHRQLRILENETSQTSIIINSLLSEINSDAARQQQYAETAANYLLSIDSPIRQGSFNGTNTYGSVSAAPALGSYSVQNLSRPTTLVSAPSGKPLFTARFNKADVQYKEGLNSAIGAAKSKKPNASFDVVAVNPVGGSSAKDKASKIFQNIVDMGVSADRVSLSARSDANIKFPEVQVFVK